MWCRLHLGRCRRDDNAQIVAQLLGVDIDDLTVVTGHTADASSL
jgi:hypothetical protein